MDDKLTLLHNSCCNDLSQCTTQILHWWEREREGRVQGVEEMGVNQIGVNMFDKMEGWGVTVMGTPSERIKKQR